MKLFFTIQELYESNFVNRYFHEISYLDEESPSLNDQFKQIQKKFSYLNSISKTQVLKFTIEKGLDLYFFDFELNQPIEFVESDFKYPLVLLLSLDTKLKITTIHSNEIIDEMFFPEFYDYPVSIEAEEKYGERVRLLLINLDASILSEYFEMNPLVLLPTLAHRINVGFLNFNSYDEIFLNSFRMSLEKMPLQKGHRPAYIRYKVLDLIFHLFEYNILIKKELSKKINFTSTDLKRIRNAKEILIADIENSPTIKQLAKQVGLNELKLKIGFKEIFATTIHSYLLNYRLEKAKYLLIHDNKSVTEVSLEVGYSSMSKFSKAFRKKYGVNPGYFKSLIK